MTRDEISALWVQVCGWLPQPTLTEALAAAEGDDSFCSLAYERRLLSAEQISQARAMTRHAVELGVDQDPRALQETFAQLFEQALAQSQRGAEAAEARAEDIQKTVMLRSDSGSHFAAGLRGSGRLSAVAVDRPGSARAHPDSAEVKALAALRAQGLGQAIREASSRESGDSTPTIHEPRSPGLEAREVLGDYRLLGEVDSGAMGAIYRAVHKPTGRLVALKRLKVDEGGGEDGSARRFQREVEVLVHLKHPNIVEIFDVGFADGASYYAMEFVKGRDLKGLVKEELQRGARPWRRSAEMIAALAGAVAYCHAEGITHRDIKPQNILVEEGTDRAVLIDFGLLKRASELGSESSGSGSRLTPSGMIVGTPAFMAPEQAAPDGAFGVVGEHSDIWGLGATLFYCLTGVPPFNRSSLLEILEAVQSSREAPRASWINPEVPPWLDELCARCLEKEPSRRPSAAVVARELGRGLSRSRRRSGRSLPRLALVFAAALGAVIGLGALISRAPPPRSGLRFATLDTREKKTVEGQVRVIGQAAAAGQRVWVGDRMAVGDSEGRFEAIVSLGPGVNRIRVKLDGSEEPAAVLVIEQDAAKPELRLANPSLGLGRYALKGEGLRGQVRDQSRARLFCDGLPVRLDEEGRFAIPLPARSPPFSVELRAVDELGNATELSLWLFPEELGDDERGAERAAEMVERAGALDRLVSDPAERARVAPLFERRRWAAARSADQERIARWAARRLGAELRFKGLEDFAAGDAKHRIAVFSHASGALFHLLPGDFIEVEWWDDPRHEYRDACLTNLLDARFEGEVLAAAFERPPFDGFAELLARELGLGAAPERSFGAQAEEGLGPRALAEQAVARLAAMPAVAAELRRVLVDRRARLREIHRPRRRREYIEPFLLARAELRGAGGALLSGLDEGEARRAARRLGSAFRLPSRLEWRYAYHAGASGRFFWGEASAEGARYSWLASNAGGPRGAHDAVRAGNAFGLVDMAGNLAEWCEPQWGLWRRRLGEEVELVGGEGGLLLGGSARQGPWESLPSMLRLVEAGGGAPALSGLRLARSLP